MSLWNSSTQRVKPEPVDDHRVLQDRNVDGGRNNLSMKPEPKVEPKAEPSDVDQLPQPTAAVASTSANRQPQMNPKAEHKEEVAVPEAIDYPKYASVLEINYSPENALAAGTQMVKHLKSKLNDLDIGSQLRKDVWRKDVEDLAAQTTPSTMIALCGATGAGKSSVINAVLDDTIVPTSGMRACTATVTEISYKPGRSIEADVVFLSAEEWKAELEVLLHDLVDEEGNLKRSSDLKSEAGVAWYKVHAVYPNIPQDYLVTLTAEQIIQRDPKVSRVLGTTKKLTCANSKEFGKAIAPFVDSKEKKRSKKDDDKDKKKDKSEGPAWWPLIRNVKVRCPSKALETGAILVDLPGTADANAARSSMAQQYMQRCQCIWILAPITRAVDDKVAKDLLGEAFRTQLMMDGNYDASTVTFIATKTDDISCTEIVSALDLDNDFTYQEIVERIEQYEDEEREQKRLKSKAENEAKDLGAKLKENREWVLEYKAHIRSLEKGEPFTPRLTAPGADKKAKKGKQVKAGQKRKSSPGSVSPKAKRRKSDLDDDDDDDDLDGFIVDDDSDVEEIVDSDRDSVASDNSDDEDNKSVKSHASSSADEKDVENFIDVDEEMEEEVTVGSLKEKLKPLEEERKVIKAALDAKKEEVRAAGKQASKLKDKIGKAQREKNGFCAKARNEYSKDVLKEDWRSGLREMDEEEAQKKDPANFDPTQQRRDYAAIDLPTFTVSSRDYIRLTKQVEGDGAPTCFSEKVDTQIPALQEWCRHLTVASRERAARSFLKQLKNFAAGVQSYVNDMTSVSEEDRAALRERWASDYGQPADQPDEDDPYANVGFGQAINDYLRGYDSDEEDNVYRPKSPQPANDQGVGPTLRREFDDLVDEVVSNLGAIFRQGLDEKMRIGSENAAHEAPQTSMSFANSMHWGTYRATLRRDGIFRRDLNAELCQPLTSSIATSWAQVFEQDLFADFQRDSAKVIRQLIEDIKNDAPPGLADRCGIQGELALEDAETATKKMIDVVAEVLQKEQKEISRSLSPNVQQQLIPAYQLAMEERGRGSVARQKACMQTQIGNLRHTLFAGATEIMMTKLTQAAETVGKALDGSLSELARKIEVDMSVLWESVTTTDKQVEYRHRLVTDMEDLLTQVKMWIQAEEIRHQPGQAQ